LAFKPNLQIIRRSRRPLLRGLEQARRSALAHHVPRIAPMGARVLINGTRYYSPLSACGPSFASHACWLISPFFATRVGLVGRSQKRSSSAMCDFSLHHVKSRPAKVGDKLTTRNFNTGTRGFAAPEDSTTAVCILPGTELAFSAEVIYASRVYGWKTRTI